MPSEKREIKSYIIQKILMISAGSGKNRYLF